MAKDTKTEPEKPVEQLHVEPVKAPEPIPVPPVPPVPMVPKWKIKNLWNQVVNVNLRDASGNLQHVTLRAAETIEWKSSDLGPDVMVKVRRNVLKVIAQ